MIRRLYTAILSLLPFRKQKANAVKPNSYLEKRDRLIYEIEAYENKRMRLRWLSARVNFDTIIQDKYQQLIELDIRHQLGYSDPVDEKTLKNR